MATRAKPKEIVAESQKPLDTVKKVFTWLAAIALIVTILVVIARGMDSPKSASPAKSQVPTSATHPTMVYGQECNGQPMIPVLLPDGSTEPVLVSEVCWVCRDPSFWEDLPRLGYRTSYKGGMEDHHTRKATGKIVYDKFRYIPEPGTRIPRHWFVPLGTNQC
jgi:hypothetical protein